MIAAGEVWTNPLIVGLVVGFPATLLGIFAYRRSAKLDKIAEDARLLANQGAAVQQVVDGLNQIVDNLQDDNKVLRDHVRDLSGRLSILGEDNRTLQKRVDALIRQYNGENGETLTP